MNLSYAIRRRVSYAVRQHVVTRADAHSRRGSQAARITAQSGNPWYALHVPTPDDTEHESYIAAGPAVARDGWPGQKYTGGALAILLVLLLLATPFILLFIVVLTEALIHRTIG
jgi:hypothetical protein